MSLTSKGTSDYSMRSILLLPVTLWLTVANYQYLWLVEIICCCTAIFWGWVRLSFWLIRSLTQQRTSKSMPSSMNSNTVNIDQPTHRPREPPKRKANTVGIDHPPHIDFENYLKENRRVLMQRLQCDVIRREK